ncbi:MAG TPA: DUF6252 family protein [Puia sp.]|nr:DUF6252 family protein [Puia sp.]
MRKAIFLSIALLAGLASCKKETSIENGNTLSGNFTARIDGVQWSASGTKEGASILGGTINITGISADNKEISITIADSVAGVYTLNQTSASYGAYADIDSSDLYAFATNQGSDTAQAGGSVTITEIDPVGKTISGTFAFKVYRDIDSRQKTITSGIFTKIPYVTSLPATASSDTLRASIDGKAWVAVNIEATSSAGQLTIVGASSDASQTIGLLMPATAKAGTYPLDGSNPSYLGVYTVLANASSSGFASTKGTLTITQNNTSTSRISGSFQFTAADPTGASTATHVISSGIFSVYYGQ